MRNRILLVLWTFVLFGCADSLSDQEKETIEKKAQKTIWEAEKFRDSVSNLRNEIQIRSKYDQTYLTVVEVLTKSTASFKDSLYMELNEPEPNYESLNGMIESWKTQRSSTNQMLSKYKASANQFY